jgi:hypothetical protein
MKVPPSRRVLVRRHFEVLVLSGLIVILALVLQVRADSRVVVAGLDEYPLPSTCMSYAWFGVKCPGCGLTRSLIHLFHGDWLASWRMHRLGWLFGALIVGQFPYRYLALQRGGRHPLGPLFPKLVGWAVIFLLFANWLSEGLERWLVSGQW